MSQRKFEDLSKDEMVMIAIMLDIPEIINLCRTNKEINRKLCKNNMFWIQKVRHDYDVFYDSGYNLSPKNFYYYTAISILKKKLGLEGSVDEIRKMTVLNLYSRGLKELPKEIGILTGLQKLWLSNNQLEELPKEIGILTGLQELSLSNNQLEKIPKEIGNLSKLQQLWLHNNQLETLPKEIGNLSQLQELSLSNNQLEEIPKEIGNLSKLQKLSLYNNKLEEIPKEIWFLTGLQRLWLDNNKLTKDQISEIKKLLPHTNILHLTIDP